MRRRDPEWEVREDSRSGQRRASQRGDSRRSNGRRRVSKRSGEGYSRRHGRGRSWSERDERRRSRSRNGRQNSKQPLSRGETAGTEEHMVAVRGRKQRRAEESSQSPSEDPDIAAERAAIAAERAALNAERMAAEREALAAERAALATERAALVAGRSVYDFVEPAEQPQADAKAAAAKASGVIAEALANSQALRETQGTAASQGAAKVPLHLRTPAQEKQQKPQQPAQEDLDALFDNCEFKVPKSLQSLYSSSSAASAPEVIGAAQQQPHSLLQAKIQKMPMDLAAHPFRQKIHMCRFFLQGSCKNKVQCNYSHNEAEMMEARRLYVQRNGPTDFLALELKRQINERNFGGPPANYN